MTDPLAAWWQWDIVVARYAGEGSNGPIHLEPVTVKGKVSTKRRMVRTADGEEVVSEARISFPALTDLIPVSSLVTFPPQFGGRTATVLADQLHHDGAGLTPNFYSIDLT